jgi:O-antigen/teichoic acid export membrane protein
VLIWLALAGCLDLATVGFEPILMALHRAGSAFLVRVLAALTMIGGIVLLTPRLGAVGAAMSLVVSTVLTAALLAFTTFRALKRTPADASEPASQTDTAS